MNIEQNELALEVSNLHQWFGNNKVLNDIDLKISKGEIVALVGPSGCGKTTLFNAILGTEPAKSGTILVNNKPHIGLSRDVGIVYQNYLLAPFLTARQNIALGLKLDRTNLPFRFFRKIQWKKMEKDHLAQAQEMLERVGLEDKGDLLPSQLSGGQRQRVAIAQALIMKPKLLLMDEPFGAVDAQTRESLQDWLLELFHLGEQTILIVTHELHEAIVVSSRVLGLSQYHSDGKNGSTIVYDKAAPIFYPEFDREIVEFSHQEEELRRVVFNSESINNDRDAHVSYWQEKQRGINEQANSK